MTRALEAAALGALALLVAAAINLGVTVTTDPAPAPQRAYGAALP